MKLELYLAFAAAEVLRSKLFILIGQRNMQATNLIISSKKKDHPPSEKPIPTHKNPHGPQSKIPTNHTQKSPRESLHLRHLATAQKLQKSYMPKL